ncbi:MAG: heat-inducible transcriptional repressor HrcA [Acidimicrobiales bacterium]|nr:heat-inducible transcriptional repressor HrcA [Acidimicrobiales bacterium]
MLEDRKAAILSAVVEEYIHTAQPVGSERVAASHAVEVSSATIRSELANLEDLGYLMQPHTSAGRVPTEKAYRFFVDHLDSPGMLDSADREQVQAFFSRSHREMEQMLADTSNLLANLTGSAAVVLAPDRDQLEVRSAQVVGLTADLALLVLVMANGTVEKHTLELVGEAAEPSEATLAVAAAHLSGALIGRRLSAVSPVPVTGEPSVDAVLRTAEMVLAERSDHVDQAWVGGTAQVAGAFDEVERVRRVLDVLERQFVVVALVKDVIDRGLSVAIGAETGLENLAGCSLVVAPYEIEGHPAGSIGVLGPTRMDYSQALATVAVVGRRLGDRLTEG